jgi:hypothetical protein
MLLAFEDRFMYRLFSNPSNLCAVFASYGTIEAVKVKCNIDLVTRRLKIPSRALLEQMKQEGISLNDVEQSTSSETDWSMMSETVLRSHLRAAFLEENKLYSALATLSLPQQALIRDLFEDSVSFLKLPSETLLRRMQDEGLGLEKFGVKHPVTTKVDKVRDKLNSLGAQPESHATSINFSTSAPVSAAVSATDPAADSLASLKQRINQLKNQQVNTVESPPTDAPNVVAIAHLQTRLKA